MRYCWLSLLALALVVAITIPTAGAPMEEVRVSFQPFQSNAGLFVAEHDGYFAAQGMRVRWVPLTGSAQILSVLLQGEIDVGATTVSPAFFNAVARGGRLRIVADKGHVAGKGSVGSVVVRRDLAGRFRTVADLKGRKIAVQTIGGLSHYVLAKALIAAGLSLDDVTLVTIPAAASVAALQGGAVDAAVLPVPLDTQAEEVGVGVKMLDFADLIPGEPTAFLFYGPSLLERRPAVGVRFLIAYLRALRRYNEGPTPRNVAIVAQYTKIDAPTIQKGGWIGIHPDARVDVAKLRRFQDWQFDIGLISVRSPVTILVDVSVLEQAWAQLGLQGR